MGLEQRRIMPEDFSNKFYRGKPPLTMKQSEATSGADYLLKEISRDVFIPQKLTKKDVKKYLEEYRSSKGISDF